MASRIYIALARMRLTSWMPVVAMLAAHVQGLEKYIPPDEISPLRNLASVIDDAEMCDPRLRELLLSRRLARLPVFYYRASNQVGAWRPLEESFSSFSARGKPAVWQHWDPDPAPEKVEDWLRERLRNNDG
ncbi:MAG: hypothetical protein IDH49_08500 [Gammaproteobacteria bacterium]|nr:hypothetical protein [Gammaproteobacteria bacterium]